jgi:AraC-like DNA-binding protein
MFSFEPASLALHENLMPCIIFGRGASVCVGNEQQQTQGRIVCIKPDILHYVEIPEGGAEIVYLDGLMLAASFRDFQELDEEFCFLPNAMATKNLDKVSQLRDRLDRRNFPVDPAIMQIVQSLYEAPIDRMTQHELSELLGLERTQALRHFKANTGQTFRKFKIWTSAVSTAQNAFNGLGIGSSGIDSGFSDAAHVARTSRTLFGMTPTDALAKLTKITAI